MTTIKKVYRIAPDVKEQILKRIKEEGISVAQVAKEYGVSWEIRTDSMCLENWLEMYTKPSIRTTQRVFTQN